MRKAKILFIKLDNVLITTRSGSKFPLHSEDWKFKLNWAEVFSGIKFDRICIIDNHISPVRNESFFLRKVENICTILEKELNLASNSVTTNFCFKEEEDFRLLPNIGMFYEMALEYEVPLTECLFIGDGDKFEQTANKVSIPYIDVITLL